MIFTLICTDRDGARELHSCHLYHRPPSSTGASPSRSRLDASIGPVVPKAALFLSLSLSISRWAPVQHDWHNGLPYDFGSGVFCQRQTRARHG